MLPAEVSCALAEDHLRRDLHTAHARALQVWASSLGLYSQGGDIPDPPEPPED